MKLSSETGKFISLALCDNFSRPTLTHAHIREDAPPGMTLEEGQGVIASTDGIRLHISKITLGDERGLVSLSQMTQWPDTRSRTWVVTPSTLDTNYPIYDHIIPSPELGLAPLLGWPNIDEATARKLNALRISALIVYSPDQQEFRFAGFYNEYSLTLPGATSGKGKRLVNPLYLRQALNCLGNDTQMTFDAEKEKPGPVKLMGGNGDMAVIMSMRPPVS